VWRKTARHAGKTAHRRRIRRAETAEMNRLLRRMQRFFAHRAQGVPIEEAGRLVGVGVGEAHGYERFIEALMEALAGDAAAECPKAEASGGVR
jgi:electron transfer flavoprotein alpha subunit